MKRMKRSSLGSLGVVLAALSCSGAQEKRLQDGAWHIRCGESMSRCTNRADVLCGDRGYHVLGGGTQGAMLGGPSGYQTRVESSELIVRCGVAPAGEEEPEEVSSERAGAPDPAPSRDLLCIPGSAQACVGPGGCAGGQACLADGSGYAACDCGSTQPAPPQPEAPTNEVAPDEASPDTAAPTDAGNPASEDGKEL